MSKRIWLAATLILGACGAPSADATGSNAGAGNPRETPATAGKPASMHDAGLDAAAAGGAGATSQPGNVAAAHDAHVNDDASDRAHDGSAADMTDGAVAEGDAAASDPDAQTPLDPGFAVGVNVHNYPKPTAYGYVEADGADRMGDGLRYLGVRYVRGPTIGDVAFLTRLASFGVTHVILGLDAKSYGKPFDANQLKAALELSVAEVTRLGLHAVVEGLNEWDLFNTRAYNDGVEPASVDTAGFVTITQRALYEAAHPLGILVLGPSVGHSQDRANLDFFPDVAPYVDIVNMHLYFGTKPESLAIAEIVANHEAFQGSGKPVWITETGVSAYGGVTEAQQADVITRGLAHFAQSGLIDTAFLYQLIDQSEPGLSGTTYTPDSGEYHFGLFDYDGVAKPAADAVKTAIVTL